MSRSMYPVINGCLLEIESCGGCDKAVADSVTRGGWRTVELATSYGVTNPVRLPRTIALVGQPNVGKSVVMNALTGTRAFVSNYPGTTVELTEGTLVFGEKRIKVIDTPGTYSLHSDTEDQRVTQRVLLEGGVDLIINVIDAANLARNLYLTLQLLDLGIPLVVALNQVDRAKAAGLEIDAKKLEDILGVPVVPVVATKCEGLRELVSSIWRGRVGKPIRFSDQVEEVIGHLEREIEKVVPEVRGRRRSHAPRALAIHLMEHDRVDEDLFEAYPELRALVERLQRQVGAGAVCSRCYRSCAFCPARDEEHPSFPTCLERTAQARAIASQVTSVRATRTMPGALRGRTVEDLLDTPTAGLVITGLTAYFSYKVVVLVMDLFDRLVTIATSPLLQWITSLAGHFPEGSFAGLFLTSLPEGLVLPFSVVFPAMFTIYMLMGFLEDTGLLPRIAVTLHRVTSFLGVPGQAVVPLILGFGCRAPAVLATRSLPDRRSRFIVSTLLSMAVPCAASLAIITGVSQVFDVNLLVVYGVVAAVFTGTGVVLGRLFRGEGEFVLEVPPLRWPSFSNVWRKSRVRMSGFFLHVLPLLMGVSVILRYLVSGGYLSFLSALGPVTSRLFGVRGEVFAAVAMTVVQRYLAPMVLLNLPLSPREATIAVSMVSLSMPCTPVSVLLVKEMGWRTAIFILILALGVSLGVGLALNLVLP